MSPCIYTSLPSFHIFLSIYPSMETVIHFCSTKNVLSPVPFQSDSKIYEIFLEVKGEQLVAGVWWSVSRSHDSSNITLTEPLNQHHEIVSSLGPA